MEEEEEEQEHEEEALPDTAETAEEEQKHEAEAEAEAEGEGGGLVVWKRETEGTAGFPVGVESLREWVRSEDWEGSPIVM